MRKQLGLTVFMLVAVTSLYASAINQEPRQSGVRQAQQRPVSVEGFRTAPSSERRLILAGLAKGSQDVSPDVARGVLRDALGANDSGEQRAALLAVAGQASAVRSKSAAGHGGDAVPLMDLAGEVDQLLTHSDPKSRHAAILAAGHVDLLRPRSGREPMALSPGMYKKLADMYATDLDGNVRTEIVKTFALLPDRRGASVSHDLFKLALDDAEPEVLQYAAMGISALRIESLLPRVVDLLDSSEAPVRIAAAQSVAGFGSAAKTHAGRLSAALATEKDAIARRTLEGALRAISR